MFAISFYSIVTGQHVKTPFVHFYIGVL